MPPNMMSQEEQSIWYHYPKNAEPESKYEET